MKMTKSNVTLTPKRAEELLKINNYPGQRPMSPVHVQRLVAKINDGRFHNADLATMKNGKCYLINGQHQCEAVITAGQSVPATLLEFEAERGDTKEQIALKFNQFNVDKGRSRGDTAWSTANAIGMGDWPRPCVVLCAAALGYLATGEYAENRGVRMDRDENAALLGKNRLECEFIRDVLYAEDVPVTRGRHLMRASVAAAMIETWRKSRLPAKAFWTNVRDGEGLQRNDPAFALREFLTQTNVNIGRGAGKKALGADAREFFVRCLTAWNAHRRGLPMERKIRYVPTAEVPAVK